MVKRPLKRLKSTGNTGNYNRTLRDITRLIRQHRKAVEKEKRKARK